MKSLLIKKKFFYFISFLIFFLFSPKKVFAVQCKIDPRIGYKDITAFTIECSGLNPNTEYAFAVYRKDESTGKNLPATSACTKTNDKGELFIIIGPYHEAGYWNAELKNRIGGLICAFGKVFYASVAFNISGPPTYQQTTCQAPGDSPGQKTGIITALGCIPTKPQQLVNWILKNAIGIGGGIAFLLITFGIFTIITSGGNPEKLNKGKDIIVSAITGLLMIIFSVVLLQIIGVDILAIPGFGK